MGDAAASGSLMADRAAARPVSVTSLASAVVWVAVLALVFRVPGSVVAIPLASVALTALTGLWTPPRGWIAPHVFLIVAIVTSTLGLVMDTGGAATVNFATLAWAFGLFASAVMLSGRSAQLAATIVRALYVGFGCAVLVATGELASGLKLQPLLYPEASNLAIESGRFLVAAWFPNYNDFAVVATCFALMSLVRALMGDGGRRERRWLMLVFFLWPSTLIALSGSRGALLALGVGSVVVVVQSIRIVRPAAIGGVVVVVAALLAAMGATWIWASPSIQDHSTQVRENIVANTLLMTPPWSRQFWLGWVELDRFTGAAGTLFPGVLMDPHNLLLEVLTWYGAPALVALLAQWAWVLRRGWWRLDVRPGWTSHAAVLLVGLTPVLGIVPSSSLRYYYVFLLLPALVSAWRSPVNPEVT